MEILIDPLPCPRPRIALRGRFPVAYYPKAYTQWKEKARERLSSLLRGVRLTGPVKLTAIFNVERPKSTKLAAPKPDIDNYLKSLMDAITASEAWDDDSQVVCIVAQKRWADLGSIDFHIETA